MLNPKLDACIDRVTTLPPAPLVLTQLLDMLGDADADSERVVQIVSTDPSLTAQIMRLCNSAAFGSATQVDDLMEAVIRLGFARVYEFVVALIGGRLMKQPQKGYGINEGELWKHTLATALCAKAMAKDRMDDEDVVFTSAILHDLGKIVLAQALENDYARLIEEIQINQHSLLEAESALLGVEHAEIGGRLLARWKFPAKLVAAVWFHHNPAAGQPYERAAAYVYMANLVAHFMGFGYGHMALAMRGRKEALEILEMSAQDLPRYMIRTFEEIENLETILKLKV